VARYLRSSLQGAPERHAGHNPAGALAIVALLGFTLIVAATGWASYSELGGEWLGELHEGVANAMLAIVGVHVLAVLLSSRLHHENLVGAMFSGRKLGSPQEGVRSAWRGVAAVMLVAVLGFWWLQWQGAPAAANAGTGPAIAAKHRHAEH
jgi:Ni,Fe-hydrogenase I cytochrome b subunit